MQDETLDYIKYDNGLIKPYHSQETTINSKFLTISAMRHHSYWQDILKTINHVKKGLKNNEIVLENYIFNNDDPDLYNFKYLRYDLTFFIDYLNNFKIDYFTFTDILGKTGELPKEEIDVSYKNILLLFNELIILNNKLYHIKKMFENCMITIDDFLDFYSNLKKHDDFNFNSKFSKLKTIEIDFQHLFNDLNQSIKDIEEWKTFLKKLLNEF